MSSLDYRSVEYDYTSLKIKSSLVNDPLLVVNVKILSPIFSDVLENIINLSFEKGVFPNKLNEAIVVPIHKNGKRDVDQSRCCQ